MKARCVSGVVRGNVFPNMPVGNSRGGPPRASRSRERRGAEADRRSRIVHLTEKVSEFVKRLFEEHARDMEQAFSFLDDPGRDALAGLLRKLGH
ncbi:MAG TPA: hypothetical protein VES20_06645 [Bryobacteraceae bacterium]|nr:hypothetical protein [Bryobacteraceae bacterium]